MNLDGKWRVRVTSGPWWFRLLNVTGNVKHIITTGVFTSGYNVARGIRWGQFVVSQDDGITLTYTERPIVDKLLVIDENNLAGEFFYNGKFVGNFTMERLIEPRAGVE